ncbi:MAG: Calx-beta domain-containing protein [Methylococcales bacterium]
MATNTKNTPAPELYHFSYGDNAELTLSFKGVAAPFSNLQLFDDKNKNGLKDAGEQLAAMFTGENGQWDLDVKVGQLTPESSFAFRSIENNGVNVSDIVSLTYTTPLPSTPTPTPVPDPTPTPTPVPVPTPVPDLLSLSSNVTEISEPNKLAITNLLPDSAVFTLTQGTPNSIVQLSNLGSAKVGTDLQFSPININVLTADLATQSATIQLDSQGRASFSLSGLEDGLVEGDETLVLKATDQVNPTNTITAPSVVVHDSTVQPQLKITRDQSDIYEPLLGQSDTASKITQTTYTITGAANSVVNVSNKGSAKVGEDLSFSAQGVWSNGDVVNQTATVKLNDKGEASFSLIALADNKLEGDENVLISIADANSPSNKADAAAVVVHDTIPPQIKISADQTELFEPGFASASAANTTQVNYSITNGTPNALVTLNNSGSAKVGDDLSVLPVNFAWINPDLNQQTVNIRLDSQGAANFSLVALGDKLTEGDEALVFKVTDTLNPSNNAVVQTVTLHDTPFVPLPVLSFTGPNISVTEGNQGLTPATVTVSLSSPATQEVTVNYQTTAGTATVDDFIDNSGTLTFAPGETTKAINLQIVGDPIVEADENFSVNLLNISNTATLGAPSIATVTIKNDDAVIPTVSFKDATVNVLEGNGGNQPNKEAELIVNLSAPATQTVTVAYQTNSGTALGKGVDYIDTAGTLTFLPGQLSQSIKVPIFGDTVQEPDENFSVTLTNPSSNAELGALVKTNVTITNDDITPVVGFKSTAISVVEGTGNKPANEAELTVELSVPSTETVTVNYNTVDGTAKSTVLPSAAATSPIDYQASAGTLTFAPGETTKTFKIPINGDAVIEPDETFSVNLTAPSSNALLGANNSATVTITNDDLPGVFFSDTDLNTTVIEGNTGINPATNLDIMVNLTSAFYEPVTVNYATSNVIALASTPLIVGDYLAANGTLTFAPGETSKAISLSIVGDLLYEPLPNEVFYLTLTGVSSNATLGPPLYMIEIIDTDG